MENKGDSLRGAVSHQASSFIVYPLIHFLKRKEKAQDMRIICCPSDVAGIKEGLAPSRRVTVSFSIPATPGRVFKYKY
jgi:hypothetical protein